jgi:hypothetical protein
MPGLYDHLNAQLGGDEPSGLTTLDITELPNDQRQVVLSLLRDQAGSNDGVTRDVLGSKLTDKLNDLDAILIELARNGWVIVLGEAPNLRYRVNLRAKRASTAGFGLWSILSDRIAKEQ